MIGAKIGKTIQFVCVGRCGDDLRPGSFRELERKDRDAACALNEDGLPGFESSVVK